MERSQAGCHGGDYLVSNITSQDFKDWLNQPETVLFMEYVERYGKDKDNEVHKCLDNNDNERAAYFNAGMLTAQHVLGLPEYIISDLKEQEGE